jgi:hypothetical protein
MSLSNEAHKHWEETMNSKVIDKIKKLLNLSKSTNEHEAANAASMAASLMAQHQISVAALEDEDDDPTASVIGSHTIDSSAHRKVVWKADLAFGVAASFGCKYYWSGARTVMVGRKGDVDSVKYIYKYLVREINRLADKSWAEYRWSDCESARGYKTAFRKGAAVVVRKRLAASRRENLSKEKENADILKSQAIVKVEQGDQAIREYYRDLSRGFGTFNSSNKVSSLEGLQAGRKAGSNIRLGGGGKGLGGGAKGIGAGTKMLGK